MNGRHSAQISAASVKLIGAHNLLKPTREMLQLRFYVTLVVLCAIDNLNDNDFFLKFLCNKETVKDNEVLLIALDRKHYGQKMAGHQPYFDTCAY